MGWKISRLSTSFLALLKEPEADAPEVVERIRAAMVACIADCMDAHTQSQPVWRELLNASEVQTLWYLRSDVMHLLCHRSGEAAARAVLHDITTLFQGHVPAALFASAKPGGIAARLRSR